MTVTDSGLIVLKSTKMHSGAWARPTHPDKDTNGGCGSTEMLEKKVTVMQEIKTSASPQEDPAMLHSQGIVCWAPQPLDSKSISVHPDLRSTAQPQLRSQIKAASPSSAGRRRCDHFTNQNKATSLVPFQRL